MFIFMYIYTYIWHLGNFKKFPFMIKIPCPFMIKSMLSYKYLPKVIKYIYICERQLFFINLNLLIIIHWSPEGSKYLMDWKKHQGERTLGKKAVHFQTQGF